MSVKSIKATVNDQEIILNYNEGTGYWESAPTAPATTSWGEQDHKYGISLEATDDAGNKTTIDRTDETFGNKLQLRVLEKTLPKISVQSPSQGAFITSATPTIQWTVTDEGSGINAATISLKIDENAAITEGISKQSTSNGYTCSYTPTQPLGEGSHTIRFNVSDNDGNVASEVSVTFKVDTVPPTMNLTLPQDNSVQGTTEIEVSGETNDETSSPVTITVQVNEGEPIPVEVSGGRFNTRVTGIVGSNKIKVTATDSAGKTTVITRTVVIDTSAPVFVEVIITPNPVDAGATYTIKVKATDD